MEDPLFRSSIDEKHGDIQTENGDLRASGTSGYNKSSRFGASGKKKIQLSFENIYITALPLGKKRHTEKPKLIINGASGTILPGQFLAILGASGAGKTTLLNYLSGREISSNL
jgi:ABC-type multidrug transport system ATPase subunit